MNSICGRVGAIAVKHNDIALLPPSRSIIAAIVLNAHDSLTSSHHPRPCIIILPPLIIIRLLAMMRNDINHANIPGQGQGDAFARAGAGVNSNNNRVVIHKDSMMMTQMI